MATVVYSERLGAISDEQLDAAAQRANLGRFVGAAPTRSGLFGQNLFLTTTDGEFVLRGAPHWVNGAPNEQWQFTKEIFFARLLHERTDVPVPWPQHYDTRSDIFGWPYVIMPRLPGASLDDRTARATLTREDQHAVARALGAGLTRLHALRWPYQGEIDPSCEFAAYPHGYVRHLADEIELMAASAERHAAINTADRAWLARVIDDACAHPARTMGGAYVHADYKLDNLVMHHAGNQWAVCGIFDLHTSCFGDGAYDVCRQACSYLDRDESLAVSFVDAWRQGADPAEINRAALTLYLTNERMKIWEYFTRPQHRADWTRATTFAAFAARYTTRLIDMLC
jgi:hygromycin-B 7''-O-kinase